VYLRTAVSTEPGGWANFGYVKMPEYRWGIFLDAPEEGRVIPGFGDHAGRARVAEVPGEYRNALRRIIVTQADTEPASASSSSAGWARPARPSRLRNLFQVNVEEGRHLWAMVYLLHAHFGKDGRDEADDLLARRSGDPDKPRILDAFNQPCPDWLTFFCFTCFTDRDGKYQLGAWPSRASTRSPAPASSCSPKRPTTSASARRAWSVCCAAGPSSPSSTPTATPATKAASTSAPCRSGSTTGSATLSTSSAREISSNAADYFASGLKGRF
jgi:benzoyl-CoA 2,3-dioxygenase component B